MTAETIRKLQRAGISCRALWSWLRCHETPAKDGCEDCWLDSKGCEETVIATLVERLLISIRQTDKALDQRDYWKGTADRMTDLVLGRTESPDGRQKRRR